MCLSPLGKMKFHSNVMFLIFGVKTPNAFFVCERMVSIDGSFGFHCCCCLFILRLFRGNIRNGNSISLFLFFSLVICKHGKVCMFW